MSWNVQIFFFTIVISYFSFINATWTNGNFFVNTRLPQNCGRLRNYIPESKFAAWGNWPWLGLMSIDGFGNSRCICILIHPQVVLSSALCIRESDSNINDIITVSFSIPGLPSFQNISVSHVHFSSSNHNSGNSIALMKLRKPLILSAAVQPICLWEENNDYSAQLNLQIGMMIGTDISNINDISGLNILQIPIRIIGKTQCQLNDKTAFNGFLKDKMCFTYTKAINNCHYIGSSAIFPRLDENGAFIFYLRGLLTQRVINCQTGKMNGLLDVAGLRSWIDSHFRTSLDSNCGRRQVQHVALVTLGNQAERGDFPWHVGLYLYSQNKNNVAYRCGGSLISSSFVVTAGHCVATTDNTIYAADRFRLVFGKHNLYVREEGATTASPSSIILHENYGYTSLQNDIALMKLNTEIMFSEYIQPVCMWDENDIRKQSIFNMIGKVPGWGADENDKFPPFLNVATVPIVNDLYCLQSHDSFYSKYLTNTTICGGYPRGNGTNVCNGDSGGGLVLPITQNDQQISWYLRGIVSVTIPKLNTRKCDPDYYAIYTDVAQYIKWINQKMKQFA